MLRILLFLLVSLSACSDSKEVINPIIVEGTWIPEKIEWEYPALDIPELREMRNGSFHTFSFKGSEMLMISTINAPGEGDSIIFNVEPGYNLFHGKFSIEDSILITSYRNVYRFIKFTGDTLHKYRTDTMLLKNGLLIFDNTIYKRTSLVDTNRINGFWTHAQSEVKKLK